MTKKRLIYLAVLLLLSALAAAFFLEKDWEMGFCKNCGANIIINEILLLSTIPIYKEKNIQENGLSLFLGQCSDNTCEISLMSRHRHWILGKIYECRSGHKELLMIYMGDNKKLLCDFLNDYIKTKDPDIKDKLKHSLKTGIRGNQEKWENDLLKQWIKYKGEQIYGK